MVRSYTTAVNIDPYVAEDIYWQQVYNICAANNIHYNDKTHYIIGYSHKGMIRGFMVIINIIAIRNI